MPLWMRWSILRWYKKKSHDLQALACLQIVGFCFNVNCSTQVFFVDSKELDIKKEVHRP